MRGVVYSPPTKDAPFLAVLFSNEGLVLNVSPVSTLVEGYRFLEDMQRKLIETAQGRI